MEFLVNLSFLNLCCDNLSKLKKRQPYHQINFYNKVFQLGWLYKKKVITKYCYWIICSNIMSKDSFKVLKNLKTTQKFL